MTWIVTKIRWAMLVAGALTCTMLYAAVAPEAALASNFGASLSGPVAQVVVRNWGALIALVGVMLIYGALRPAARRFALALATTSKLIFLGLLLTYGRELLDHGIRVAAVVDSIEVSWFAIYLAKTRAGESVSG